MWSKQPPPGTSGTIPQTFLTDGEVTDDAGSDDVSIGGGGGGGGGSFPG